MTAIPVTEEKKPSKKFAVGGGELPPSPTTSTTVKRPTRHHVKRRSSGRVHVTKLAPMARAHEEQDEAKKAMKRSQSNKSLNRLPLSSDKKNMGVLTSFTPAVSNNNKEEEEEEEVIQEQMKEQEVISTPPTTPPQKPLLKSHFIDTTKMPISNAASHMNGMTRTQQKLLLQREQSLIHDENNISHPKNMIRLTREMEKMAKEYRCVRKYQDPMMDSLFRCTAVKPQREVVQPHLRMQMLLNYQQSEPVEEKWTASTFIDKLFFGI